MKCCKKNRLVCGAILTALLAGGCSNLNLNPFSRSQPEPQLPPSPVATTPDISSPTFASLAEAQGPSPRLVNVFGEFGGIERKPGNLGGQSSFQQHTNCDEGYDADVSIDPGGKWIAFSSTRHSEHADIYLQRVDGTSVIQLTTDPSDDVQPSFSPDGKRIAFCSSRSGHWNIFMMDIDGKNVEQVTNGAAQDMHPSFSPDGTRLVFSSLSSRSDQWELWTMNLATRERKMIGHGLFPTWSPLRDVDRIAFQRPRQRGSRWFSLWTVDLLDGEPRRMTEVAVSSNAAVIWPSWSPDGNRLAFATVITPTGPGVEKSADHQDIWIVNADGSGRQRITEGGGTNLAPFWAVSNRIFFISDRGGHENVWSVRAEGIKATATASSETGRGGGKEPSAAKGKLAEPLAPGAIGAIDTTDVTR